MNDIKAAFPRLFPYLALGVFLILTGQEIEASWWLEDARFHASAHGQLACGDCHAGIAARPLHPDPRRTAHGGRDAFDAATCTGCHRGVAQELEENRHGSAPVENPAGHADCLRCHDPHAAAAGSARAKGYDPGRPPREQCGVCHAPQKALPAPGAGEEGCLGCHRRPEPGDPQAPGHVERFCRHCHGNEGTEPQAITGRVVPLMEPEALRGTPHAEVACTACHPRAAAYGHDRQIRTPCTGCHLRHGESQAHDAHLSVACEACHLQGGTPVRDHATQRITLKRSRRLEAPLRSHEMVDVKDRSECRRCHFSENPLGAAAAVLPAKSVLCLPCHPATLSAADIPTRVALSVFAVGLALEGLVVFSGRGGAAPLTAHARGRHPRPPGEGRQSSLPRAASALKAALADVLLQRRLFRASRLRWLIHGLIFFPMAVRCAWGLLGLAASVWAPAWPAAWVLLDRNHPLSEAVFEISGVMILAGVALSAARGRREARGQMPGLPRRDWPALALIGAIVAAGFVLEGLRMAMTGSGTGLAFVGFGIAKLVSGHPGLTEAYGYGWYLHAILAGAMVAYLPFSRLRHVIFAPVLLAWEALDPHR
jgi:nitrate reductase gamma subunit